MTNRPRKHHYISAFYLAGFTDSGSERDRLFVFDQGQIQSWPSTPRNAGHERDFYAVELGPDVDPATFESRVLAPIEGEFSRVIRACVENEKLPNGDDFDVLLNFVAVTATRTPRTRNMVGQVTNLLIRSKVQSLVATDDGWREFRKYFAENADQNDDGQMRQFILSDDYQVDLDQTSHVQKIVEMTDGLLQVLAERHWSLGVAAPNAPDFVCSDSPVSGSLTNRFDFKEQPNITHPHTIISIPLSRRAVLLGCYDERPAMFYVNEFGVLSLNAITIREARQVFSRETDFTYLGSDRQTKHRADLEESLRRRSGKYSDLNEAVTHWFKTRMCGTT